MKKNTTLSALIVDDEKKSREFIAMLIHDICPEIEVVGMVPTVKEALHAIEETQPELVFLDIQLKSEQGFDLLKRVPEITFETIFTTAHAEYAIEAIHFSALDYLLKPIDPQELQRAVRRAVDRKDRSFSQVQMQNLLEHFKNAKSNSLKIALPTVDGLVFINIQEIIYLEADSSYTKIMTEQGRSFTVTKVLKEYESLLASKNFFRIHNSSIINLNKLEKYIKGDGGQVIMQNGVTLDVSKRRKQAFLGIIGR